MVEKKLYETPFAKLFVFESQDVITASTTTPTTDEMFSTDKEFKDWY